MNKTLVKSLAVMLMVLVPVVVFVGCDGTIAPGDGGDVVTGGDTGGDTGGGDGGGGDTASNAPTLQGLDANKATTMPITVQAAYNDDTMFFRISWEGDRGDVHDQVHFTNGAWQREGWPRRDAQASIDGDEIRGPTGATSTIYESRVTFMVDDPQGPNAVPGFAQFGCMLTCHDNSRAMPRWKEADGEVTKYLLAETTGTLDLWHHRLARANPIGVSDDQHVTQIPEGGTEGGRFGDAGDGPWQTNGIGDDGNPPYAFDPDTTGGLFAYPWDEVFTSEFRSFRREDAPEMGVGSVAVGIDYADAVAMGYVPQEGDTIPRRRLRQPTESRGDITAYGTTFVASSGDPLFGRWNSNTQRLLDTGNADDTALADGGVYNIAFAVHTGMVTVRDHYISFPQTLSLGGGDADIQAVKIAGSGRDTLPDFSDASTFPVTDLNLFLPGITSYEYVTGQDTDLEYIDPATGASVNQVHAGAAFLTGQGLGCRDCHTVKSSESFAPPQSGGFASGSMEEHVPERGGVNTPTPLPPG